MTEVHNGLHMIVTRVVISLLHGARVMFSFREILDKGLPSASVFGLSFLL